MKLRVLRGLVSVMSFGITVSGISAFAQSAPSADDFFDYVEMSRPSMSDDGKSLCIVDSRNDKAQQVLIIDLDDQANPFVLPFGDQEVNWCDWATNDRLIVSATVERRVNVGRKAGSRMTSGVNGIEFNLLVGVNKDGTNSKVISGNTGTAIDLLSGFTRINSRLPNDPDHVIIKAWDQGYNLYKVNILDGDWETIEEGDRFTYDYKVNRNGYPTVRYDSVNRQRNVRIMVRAEGEERWTELTTVRQEDLESFSPIADTDTPGVMYVSARPEGHDRASIFTYDLKTKTFLETVSTNDKVDLYRVLTTSGGKFAGTVYYDERLTYDFADKSLQSYLKGTDAYFGGEMDMSIVDMSDDGKRWTMFVDSPRHPGSYYTFDLNKKTIDKIYDRIEGISENQLGKTDWISYQTRDGVTLNAYLTHPSKGASAQAPLIVMPHGGPEARDTYGYDQLVQYFASRGYRIFQPQFRGSSGYGEKFASAGYGQWGMMMQDDVTDGVKHLINTGKAQQGNICIAGASYGGYAALMGAVKTPELYECAISIAGVTDLRAMVIREGREFKKSSAVYKYWVKAIGDPSKDKERLNAMSPAQQASTINIPTLVIQGGDDDVVPPEQGRIFNKAMKKAGKDIRYIEYENMNHNLIGLTEAMKDTDDDSDDDRYVYYKKTLQEMETFLAQHLK